MTWQQTIDEEKDIAFEKGQNLGRELGARETAIANAKKFLHMNILSPEQIAEGTSLPLEEVLALKEELAQKTISSQA